MITGRDVVLGVLPLFHVYGLNAVLGQVLRQQARLVLVDGFDPEGSLDLIEDEAISVLPVAPPVFAYWMQRARPRGPARARCGWCSAARRRSTRRSPTRSPSAPASTIHQGYGLTEAAPVVTSTLCSENPTSRSVGAALPGIEIRLVDEHGREPHDEDGGEIQIRGDNLFSGYWPDGADGPDERRLVADRRRRLPRPHRRPLPGRPGQGAGDRLRLQRLPERGRGRHRRAARRSPRRP